ncbi:large ribosomal subunit protein mL45 isoform X1 [Callithrix jacchus]
MAAPVAEGLSCVSRVFGWWSRQPVLVTQSAAIVPVRTKKRFTPPTYPPKFKTEKEFLEHARKAGVVIPPERLERPIHLACSAGIFDAYVPPEGDARISFLSREGLKQKTERMKKTMASQVAIRKIKEHDASFKIKDFPEKAKDIFIEAHLCLNNSPSYFFFFEDIFIEDQLCLNNSDHDRLHTLVTEHCFPDMTWDIKCKTVRWSFVESLEPSHVVQVRCSSMVNESNMYGQVTVRMHTRQTLAIYDRFGRLMYGQEDVPKDVLEYVVFEKQLVNPYGSWRMHGKIVPSWAPPKQPIIKTVMIPGPQLKPGEEYEEAQGEAQKPQLA